MGVDWVLAGGWISIAVCIAVTLYECINAFKCYRDTGSSSDIAALLLVTSSVSISAAAGCACKCCWGCLGTSPTAQLGVVCACTLALAQGIIDTAGNCAPAVETTVVVFGFAGISVVLFTYTLCRSTP